MFSHVKRLLAYMTALEGKEPSFPALEEDMHLTEEEREEITLKIIQDLAFINQGHMSELPENPRTSALCPTEDLLLAYYFDRIDDEEIQRLVVRHVDHCQECQEVLKALDSKFQQAQAFVAQIPSVIDEVLRRGREQALSPLLEVLKKVASHYLKESLIEPLFRNLQELSPSKKIQIIQRGLVPGLAAVRGKKSAKRKEFEKMLKSLLTEETELNALIQQGDKEKIKLRLSQLLDDEQVVEEIMSHI